MTYVPSALVFHHWIPFSSKNATARREVCFGSLSCMNRCPFGYLSLMKGTSVTSKMFTYRSAFMIPSKMQTVVAPFQLIPPHTWTFTGCFGLGLFRGFWPFLRQQKRRCVSSCTLVSSVQMTSSNGSPRYCWAHSKRFCLFTSLMSWQ